MKLIQDQWLSYRAKVVPANAPAIQVTECRRAFYAGAEAMRRAVMAALSPEPGVTEDDLTVMLAIDNELKEFAEQVKAGVA